MPWFTHFCKGHWKNLHQQPQKKKGGGGGSAAPELCEVCLRPSAISADVTHAVGVADLAPATEARLFAPFAVVVAVLAPEARLFAPFGHLNIFLWLWVWVDFQVWRYFSPSPPHPDQLLMSADSCVWCVKWKWQILTCFYVHACMVLQFSREYDIPLCRILVRIVEPYMHAHRNTSVFVTFTSHAHRTQLSAEIVHTVVITLFLTIPKVIYLFCLSSHSRPLAKPCVPHARLWTPPRSGLESCLGIL